MDPQLRIVTHLPLDELWNDGDPVGATRGIDLSAADVKARLRDGCDAVVADLGAHLRWMSGQTLFDWWKAEGAPRLLDAAQETWRLEDLRDERGWRASEWTLRDGARVLSFEAQH